MKKYDTYKDSGIEWLGEIPEHWEVKRLASIGRFSASGIDKLSKKNESAVKIINYTDVYRNPTLTINKKMDLMVVTTPEENRVRSLVKKGDLIFLPSSETFEDLGLSALVDEDLDNTSFSYHVLRFVFNEELDHNFKKYFTNNSKILNQFSRKGTGSIRKTLSRNDFRNILVILPPLFEQQKIATFLDEKTSKIDQTIAQKEALIALLKERKQIIIQDLVTGKKVWNEEKQEWTKPEKVKDSGVEWIGEIPEGWEVKNLRYGFKFLNHRRIPLSAVERDDLKGNYPYYGASGIIDYVNDYIFDEKTILIAEDGANLLSKSTPLAFVAEGKYWVNNHAHILKPKYKGFRYWAELLSLIDYTIYISGAAQPKLSRENLGSVKIIVPSKSEIEVISQYIESQSSKIDQAINIQEQQIEKLKEYKATLIDSAVTGKVRVS